MTLAIKRVYAPWNDDDGTRILVDRLWPRGLTKEKARIDHWLKELAPSAALRRQFHGKPGDWDAFCAAYFAELQADGSRDALRIVEDCLRRGHVSLLYAARDETHNNAAALRSWLEKRPAGA